MPEVATTSRPELHEAAGRADPQRLVPVGQGHEHGALGRQPGARRQLALGEGQAERAVDAHHLAGGAHLGAEQGVGVGEAAEGQDRLLDRQVPAGAGGRSSPSARSSASVAPTIKRAAALTRGTPVALATNGTVRDARGLASSTNTWPAFTAYWTLMSPTTSRAAAMARV